MDRDVLYRGKRIDDGEWVYGYIVNDMEKWFILCKEKEKDFRLTWFEVKPETVGEYTGTKDKNDKKIFEGDLLQDKVTHVFEVIRMKYGWGIKFIDLHIECEEYLDDELLVYYAPKIIGNKFENPELMKE